MEARTAPGPWTASWRFLPLASAGLAALAGCNGPSSGGEPPRDAGSAVTSDGSPPGSGTGGGTPAGGAPSGGGTGEAGGSTHAGAGGLSSAGGAGGRSGGAGGGASTGGKPNAGGMAGTGGTGGTGGTSSVAEIRVVGRTEGDPKSPRFEWPGVSIQAHFKGTNVTADLDGGNNNFFEVVVDGITKPKVATTSGRGKVPIVSGLPDAEHDLVIWRRTEANNYSPSQFFGLDFGTGTLLPITAPSHKLEIIGDSITCGYGDEGAGPNCGFSFDTENSYLAYGSVAARELGADLYTEAWSGKGMYRNYGGDTTDTIPTIWNRAIPSDGASTWAFAWKPDAVVIDLGTNDFAKGDPGQPFVNAYEGFVADLRTHYPNSYVFLVIGPLLGGTSLTQARSYLDDVVKARKALGDARIQQLLVDPQDSQKNGIGCDYHPSVATHAIMGKALAASMKTALGW
jgi:lysophospholipase L1-like esterase